MAEIEHLTERQKVLLVSPQLPTDEHIVAGATALRIIDQLTALTTPPDFGVEHKLLADWINSLPEPFRSFVTALETNADPSGNIRDAVCQRENAEATAARVKELEALLHETNMALGALLRTSDARIAELEQSNAALGERVRQLNESNDCFMRSSELANAEADRSKARIRELEAQLQTRDARIAEALRILATPRSAFTAKVRKALTDG